MSGIFTDSALLTQIVATALGFLSGLGVGGGSLLILWLTLAQSFSPAEARSVNLLFFLPAATASLLLRFRRKTVDVRRLLPGILAGCVTAVVFSLLGQHLDTTLLKKLFGGLLLCVGLKELCFRPKK